MRIETYLAQRSWQRASIRGREYAEHKLAALRPARSPITAPTGRFFRVLSALPPIPPLVVIAALILGGIGCLLIARYGWPF